MSEDDWTTTFRSTGDLSLDRRYGWAMGALARGAASEAAEILRSIVELAPDWSPGWFALGDVLEDAGDAAGAADSFGAALRQDPQDRLGASLRLARLSGDAAEAPVAYVRSLFDGYASRFEAHLVDGLAYRGPQALAAAALAAAAARGRAGEFTTALDLGCGTGLAARAFAPFCDRLEGVDLSPRMIEAARRTGLYDALHAGELTDWLEAQPPGRADLLVAADVFVYFGSLDRVFAAASRAMAHEGLFVASLQRAEARETPVLGTDLRFWHPRSAIEGSAARAGLRIVDLEPQSIRCEKGAETPGWIAVLAPA